MAGIIAPQHQNEDAARKHLEGIRWPDGPICPHCGSINDSTKLEAQEGLPATAERKAKKFSTHAREGVYKCRGCEKQFSVTVGTIFESSHIPLHKWLLAVHLMCSSKKGISAHQLMRNLEIGSYRSAWFMAHRIRWAMHEEPMSTKLQGTVEVDEVYIGGREPGMMGKPGAPSKKATVVSMVERGEKGKGRVRSVHMDRVTADNLRSALRAGIERSATLNTDDSSMYWGIGQYWKDHQSVNHTRKEYVRYENGQKVTTNSVEGFFGLLKRGINGTFHHVGKKHLHRYLSEFDFRYNLRDIEDAERAVLTVKATGGKRLMLKTPKAPRS